LHLQLLAFKTDIAEYVLSSWEPVSDDEITDEELDEPPTKRRRQTRHLCHQHIVELLVTTGLRRPPPSFRRGAAMLTVQPEAK